MREMSRYSLIIGFICSANATTFLLVNAEPKACGKLVKGWNRFDCVVTTECPVLDEVIRNGQVAHCGNEVGADAGVAKVCCPRSSASASRLAREAEVPSKDDPYYIVQQKCNEYSAARYVLKVSPPVTPNRPSITTRKLDCVKAQPLISKGVAAKLKEFPHMALIGYNSLSDKPNDTIWACGGSLISERYVLTAAHCISNGNVVANWVRLGELVLNDDSESSQPRDFRIEQLVPHPQYNSWSVYFDIMLVKLGETVQFTPYMRPICLYTSSVLAPALHSKALITGWGFTGTGEQTSDRLLKAQIIFAEDGECVAHYKGYEKLANGYDPATMICAGDKLEGKDTCGGDSGGPLQVPIPDWTCMYSQVGITSFGSVICGQKNISSVYTRISSYIPWIQSIVWP